MSNIKNIAIFASGSGSNAENIFNYFRDSENVRINLILTNNKNAFVIERSKKLNIPYIVFNRDMFYKSDEIINILKENNTDFIVLAGFLWLIPEQLINAYRNKIVNIHPAILPKYGGKGMYGERVHEAVVANKEKESGITIHYVNENYDEGDIIFQEKCDVKENDTANDVANKIHKMEYKYFPKVIANLINKL